MRIFKLVIVFILLISCRDRNNSVSNKSTILTDTIIKHDTIFISENEDWQKNFGLTHDPDKDSIWYKPVSYYLSDVNCSGLARDFYQGTLRPADDGTTEELLKLVTTDNAQLRPFYRWCLNKTIQIQDGALAEYTGVPARQYAEKFPKEFFEYMDFDTTGLKYNVWLGSLQYSGFYKTDDFRKPQEISKRMAKTMKYNCNNCSKELFRRIDVFAKECFH